MVYNILTSQGEQQFSIWFFEDAKPWATEKPRTLFSLTGKENARTGAALRRQLWEHLFLISLDVFYHSLSRGHSGCLEVVINSDFPFCGSAGLIWAFSLLFVCLSSHFHCHLQRTAGATSWTLLASIQLWTLKKTYESMPESLALRRIFSFRRYIAYSLKTSLLQTTSNI